jgi:hypothetical protein
MPTGYTLITSTTIGSGGASTFTFSSIPSTYTDLLIKASTRTNRGDDAIDGFNIQFNGDTNGGNYTGLQLFGSGSSVGSNTAARAGLINGGLATSNSFASNEIYIPNYRGSTNKTFSADGVTETNATTAYQAINSFLWSNTSAITSILLTMSNGSAFVQYSTFYLYGIKNS